VIDETNRRNHLRQHCGARILAAQAAIDVGGVKTHCDPIRRVMQS
jgi:hypothetical protein